MKKDQTPDNYLNVSTDTQKENPFRFPSDYSLIEIFKDLKFGRPLESQKYLDKCITELEQGQY